MTPKHAKKRTSTPTWSTLSDQLGFARQTVSRWRHLPDAPKTPDAAAWTAYIEANDLGRKEPSALTALKIKIAQEDLQRKQRQNQIEAGEVISLPEKIEFMRQFAAKLNQLLILKLETETPARLVGKGIVEARKEARQIHDEVWEIINANLQEWDGKG